MAPSAVEDESFSSKTGHEQGRHVRESAQEAPPLDEDDDGRPNKNLKRHAVSFTKGLPGASAMRVELHSEHDQIKLGDRVAKYLQELAHECSIATP